MKFAVALTLLLLLSLSLSPPGVRGDGECECGLLLSEGEWVHELHTLSQTLNLDTCRSYIPCRRFCLEQFLEASDGGQLVERFGGGETSLGDLLCGQLTIRGHPYLPPSQVDLYMSMCGGDWEWLEVRASEPLCCLSGHYASCRGLGAANTKMISSPALRHARAQTQSQPFVADSRSMPRPSPPQPSVANM